MADNTTVVAEPPQETTPSLIEDARAMIEDGTINQLPPAKRIKLLKLIEPTMVKEREEALQPAAELAAKDKNESSFIDQIMAPIRSTIKDPAGAVLSTARGMERAFNPAGLVGVDLETLEGIANFPIIRGAELAARMFVPEDQRPNLTTFSQVVNDQRRMDKNLRTVHPGIQEGAELGTAVYGLTQLARAALPEAGRLIKKGVSYIKAGQAEKALQNVKQMAIRRLKVSDGPLLDAIVDRPEQVLAKAKQSGTEIKDVAFQLQDELQKIGENLGKKVGQFREAAFKDTSTRIPVPDEIPGLIKSLRSRTTFQDESVLPPFIEKQLKAAEKAAEFGVTNPNQAMVWVDALDGIIKYGDSDKVGSNVIKSANNVLMQLRGSIKSMLRNSNPKASQWAEADDAFSGFLNESAGITSRLQGDNAESLVSNLFGKNKTIMRDRLERSLDYMNRLDPTANGHGNAFMSRLADLKAGEKVKDVTMEVNRVLQENTNEIVRYWTNLGGEAGGLAIGGPATFSANALGGGGLTAPIGVGGYMAGRLAGKQAGFKIGQMMANPERVLNAAIKAKQLSTQARKLAQDMLYLNKNFGPKSSIAFLDLVGPIPVVNELVKYTQSNKGEENARR